MFVPPAPKKAKRDDVSAVERLRIDDSVYCEDEEMDSDFTMFFVKVPIDHEDKPTENELTAHEQLYKILHRIEFLPKWIGVNEVFEYDKKDDFFVVPMFRGSVFKRLCREGFRLYGPPIVKECMNEEKPLPRWVHPVYSSVFENARVCFTGFTPDRRRELSDKVAWMNGVVSNAFYEGLTHLVANKADPNSEKFKIAIRCKIPIMMSSWIEDLWEKTQYDTISALDCDVVDAYKLPIFSGLSMTLSRVIGSDRLNLMKLIEEHGGKVSGSMVRSSCTHLVTDETVGEKYKKATEWGIKIVQVRWIRKCIDAGHIIDETKYHPSSISLERLRSSTPNKDQSMRENTFDVSHISGTGGRLNITHDSSTIMTPPVAKNLTHSIRGNTTVVASTTMEPVNECINRTVEVIAKPEMTITVSKINEMVEECLERLQEETDVFEGCMIWLCGIEPSMNEKWRKLLDRSGATRVNRIESATHVVVGTISNQSDKALIRKNMNQPDIIIVNGFWVIECLKQNSLVPPEDFEWNDNIEESQMSQTIRATDVSMRKEYASEESAVKMTGIFSNLKFYAHPVMNEKKREEVSKKICENGGVMVDLSKADYVIFEHMAPINLLLEYDSTITHLYIEFCILLGRFIGLSECPLFVPLPKPPSKLFNGLMFILFSRNGLLKKHIRELITANGGHVYDHGDQLPFRDTPYYIFIDKVDDSDEFSSFPKKNILDLSWVVDSLSKCRLQPPGDHMFDEQPMKNYNGRTDDIWDKCFREKENTVLINSSMSECSTSTNINQLNSPLQPANLKKPYKMRLQLDDVNEVINNIPSPARETDDSLTTSRIGEILQKAVVRTGRRDLGQTMNEKKNRVIPVVNPRKAASSFAALCNTQVDEDGKIAETSKPVMEINTTISSDDAEEMNATQRLNEEESQNFNIQPHIVLSISNMSVEERNEMREDILSLGGIVYEEYTWEATHLISAKLNRTPKTLSAIASGKWCLVPDYVKKSRLAGRWLKEDEFEWTVEKLSENSSMLEKRIAACCTVWRKRIAHMPITSSIRLETRHNGAFTGWRSVFYQEDTRSIQVISILEAGGALVNTVTDYIQIMPFKPTHVFTTKDFKWNPQSTAMLKRAGIPLLTFDYIFEFLVNENIDLRKYFHYTMNQA